MQNILAAENVSVPHTSRTLHKHFTSRILHEHSFYPYYIQRMKTLLLLTIVQGWYFANGFLQNALQTCSL
jgi:hypothetical protein